MTKGPELTQINSPVFTVGQLNTAFTKINTSFENTLSRDGSSPNNMLADLDMDSNDILNVGNLDGTSINVDSATIGGKLFTGTITWEGDWLTATVYRKLDLVRKDGVLYICLIEHTSDVFMTDLTNLKWGLFIDNTEGPQGPPGLDGSDGANGVGVPAGGTTGQVLAKIDNTDYNTQWVTGGGGGATDLGYTASTRLLTSSTGADVTLPLVGSDPGLMSAADKTKLDAISGTNTGDQTSIVGITGTKAQFDTAVTDGNFMYVGDAPTAHTHTLAAITDVTMTVANLNSLDDGADSTLHFHATDRARANHTGTQTASTVSDFNEAAQDAVGGMVDTTLVYSDATPSIGRAALTGAITVSAGSNTTALGSFTKAQLDTAVSDGNVMYIGDAPTAHTHTLAAITDVTITVANLNTLDDGANTTLHFHNTDRDRANHTGTQLASTISDFSEAVDDRISALVVAGTNMTITYNDGAGTLTFDAAGGGAGTNLTYTAATRVLASDTGTDATLPLVTSGDAGLAPASGGGTTNFLRADGTWAAPSGGGGGLSDGNYGDVTVSASATVIRVNPKIKFGLPRAMSRGLYF